ncbi:MAG TPA: beta-ketoacyl-[acyl-carrier-protein] synthase family protein [Kiritimatiellia bacterium]|nr:beta-ketoacyl-[acyl-carrier-protein] synthase family protein [Kiritimatiellia bacterium]HPS06422.1 beta-ketoacyl-[acyl-carrier-protein] synthase family protein [Kiritimatiellia bacterium]
MLSQPSSTSGLLPSQPALIAITGLGAVTPFGSGVDALWQALLRGASAISDMDLFDLGGLACTQAGVIRNYAPPEGFENGPRASGFAAGACREALAQAGLADDPASLAETALITASNFGDIDAGEAALIPLGHEGRSAAASRFCAHTAPAAALADAFRLGGLRIPLSLSCSSGAAATATAANLITAGHAQRVLVVGYDAISRFSWSGLCSLRTMTKDAVRPFDVNRSGTIFTEGAAALVIERADLCAARGAKPLALLRGWATGNNGHHMTAPAPRGAGSEHVMREALTLAGIAPGAVDHINVHGTGTKPNDSTETQAIQDLFGSRSASIPVTSVKGRLGHMLGAAGSVELVVSVLSLQHGVIPPTGNLVSQDPECPLDVVTAPRTVPLSCVLSNSAGFGGCNAAAVLTKADTPLSAQPTACSPQPSPVLITGLGVISALGADAEETAAALQENEPALFPLSRFALPERAEPPFVGEAPDPDLAACGVAPKPYLDRASALFLAACGMAFQRADLDAEKLAARGAGVMAGTAWGCIGTAELFFADYVLKGPRLVKPFLFPHAYSNTAVSLAAMEWSLKGPHENAASPATASGIALVEAADLIRAGSAGVIAAGGTEALSAVSLGARAADRTSIPAGEAAATLVLESEASAAARGAQPLGKLLGCGLAATLRGAADRALAQARIGRADLAAVYVNEAARATAAALFTQVQVTAPETLCGDVQGATTALHLAFALLAAHAGPVLILTADVNTCVALVAARV